MRLLASLLVCAFALPLQAEEKVLNLYNWADYVPQQALQRFQAETGIRVKYDSFDSTEVLESKLLTGGSGYDLVFPSSSVLGRAISAKALQPVGELANRGNLDPELLAKLAGIDPGNAYGVPYTWGTVGLGINREAVEQRLPGVALDSLDLLFKPEYGSKLKDCGISVLDSPQEVIAVVLNYLGKDPYSKDQADYDAAGKLLKSIRPSVTRFVGSGSDYIDQMARGQICAVLGWSGDIMIAANRAKESKTGQTIQALVPKSGGLLFFDVMAIPKDAKNVANAHKWIDYIMRPEVHAGLSNTVFYANPNKASLAHVKPEIAKNPAIFPSEQVLATMLPPGVPDQATRRIITRTFTNFKANR